MSSLADRLNQVQKTAVDQAVSMLKKRGRCMIVMTTGTGKTITGSKIMKRFPRSKVLWLTQTEELIFQTRLDLQTIFGEEAVGLFKRRTQDRDHRIIVASLQTIEKDKYLRSMKRDEFDLLVVDEAHHAKARMWEKVIRYFKAKRLGLTATPERSDGQDISELFGNEAIRISYTEAKKLRLIAEEEYKVVLTNSKVEGLLTKTGEYKPRELDRLVVSENRNEIIVESYKKYGRKFMRDHSLPYKAICFCISVSHAFRMKSLFNDHGIRAEVLVSRHFYHSEHIKPQTEAERRETYQAFLSGGGVEILCVVNVLNEGKNIRDVGCLLMARPTRSATIYMQQMGRGCRRIDGKKEKFLVLDYVDLINQKYPPMSLRRIEGERPAPTDFIVDYYRGADPLVVDEYVEYISPDTPMTPEKKWTKAKVAEAILHFYSEHGFIRYSDLVSRKSNLPNPTTIRRYWGSVADCFKELHIDGVSEKQRWTKDQVERAILQFYELHGSIDVVDLGSHNKLPSRRMVDKYWGSWSQCEKALQLGIWSRDKILEAIREYKKRRGVYPKKTELKNSNGLPTYKTIRDRFGSFLAALTAA